MGLNSLNLACSVSVSSGVYHFGAHGVSGVSTFLVTVFVILFEYVPLLHYCILIYVSVLSAFSPSVLLFPISNSGFASLSASISSSVLALSSFPSFSSISFPNIAPSIPPSSVLVFFLPSVVPSVLSVSSFNPLPSFPLVLPPPGFLLFLLLPLLLVSSFGRFLRLLLFRLFLLFLLLQLFLLFLFSIASAPTGFLFRPSCFCSSLPSVLCFCSSFLFYYFGFLFVSYSNLFFLFYFLFLLGFASYSARTLGLSAVCLTFGCWFVRSGCTVFHLCSSYFPLLSAAHCSDFSSCSSLFLCALWSLAAILPLLFPPPFLRAFRWGVFPSLLRFSFFQGSLLWFWLRDSSFAPSPSVSLRVYFLRFCFLMLFFTCSSFRAPSRFK